MAKWQAILKADEGEKFKQEVVDWLGEWTIPEYFGHIIHEPVEEVYAALNRYILPNARKNHDPEDGGSKLITGNYDSEESRAAYKKNRYWENDHPQLEQAQKEIEDIATRWNKEMDTSSYKEVPESYWTEES